MNELGWKSRRTYDGLGRLTKTETFMVGASYATESYTYDGANRVIKTVDASGRTFRSSYDLLGRTIDMTKPDGSTVRNFYNDLGSWVRYTDEDGNNQCKVYDRAGRLISVIEKASILCETGVTTNYYYDELGKIVRAVTSTLKTTSHTYDNLRRLTGTVYP